MGEQGSCNRICCPDRKRLFPHLRSDRTMNCCNLCFCTKLRIIILLLVTIIGVALSAFGFSFLFQDSRRDNVIPQDKFVKREGNRTRYNRIRKGLMGAKRNTVHGFTGSQRRWLDREREFLCELSIQPCAPFPSSWGKNDMIDGKLEQLLSDIVEGSFSQTGVMNTIKSGQEKDQLNNIKYSTWNSTKQTLKDMGNDILNDDDGKVNYLGHKFDEDAETGKRINTAIGQNKYISRCMLVLERMQKKLRTQPISVLEITLDVLHEFCLEFDKWNTAYYTGGTIKWYFQNLPFKQKSQLLHHRLDQCFAVMPPWFLQTMNLTVRTLKALKDTKLPYKLSVLNDSTSYNFVSQYLFEMLDDYTDQKSQKKVPRVTDKNRRQPADWYLRAILKWKLLGATQINSKHRIETMRKNKATLRRMGVEQSQLEKRTSANRVLERLARLFNNLAPTLGGWAKELSGILENRELRRVDHGLEKRLKSNKDGSDWRAEGAM